MFRFVILSTFAVLAIALDVELLKDAFLKIQQANNKCCKTVLTLPDELVNAIDECSKIPMDELSCERDICLATKGGFITGDNKVDMAKAVEIVKQTTKDNPKLQAAIKNNCINGDFVKYGPPSLCELRKYRHCVEMQQYSTCDDWSDDASCAGAKEAAKTLAAALN